MDTLKPCPFCGSTNIEIISDVYEFAGSTVIEDGVKHVLDSNRYIYQAMCDDCCARSASVCDDKELAIEEWNTRVKENKRK